MILMQEGRTLLQQIDERLPDRVPSLRGSAFYAFRLFWLIAFALAIVGPLMGLFGQFTTPSRNSQLILGSRAGFAVAPQDATQIRFVVGPYSRAAGIRNGDKIIRVYGRTLPDQMPVTEAALERKMTNPAYIAIGSLLFGAQEEQIPLTVRAPDGSIRDVTITTGEKHIDAAGGAIGISPKLLSFLSSNLHVLVYPILIWIAVVLYWRNPSQPVPSFLSLSILLAMGTQAPSASFVAQLGLPRVAHVAFYDFANVILLAAVLLFPDGKLRPRLILAPFSLLPVLFFLRGQAYEGVFLVILFVAVAVFVKRLKESTGVTKQQLKFLLVGVAAYPLFRMLFFTFDVIKWNATGLGQRLALDAAADVTLGVSIVPLFLVLFSGLRRHRLYDADALFSRSAMIAAVTLTIASFFAVTSATLERTADSIFDRDAGPWPSLIAAAAAALLIKPAQRRIHDWADQRFQAGLFELRTELPKQMDDLRETASPKALLEHSLESIASALRATGATALLGKRPIVNIGLARKEVRQWLNSTHLDERGTLECDRSDPFLPLRLPLRTGNCGSSPVGWILLSPRPDGSIYSQDERAVLLDIAQPIARAIDVSRQRQQIISADRRLREQQERRLQQIEERLERLFQRVDTVKIVSS